MRKDKEKAIEMRRSGKSYAEIFALLKIPKSTLSDWFANSDWSHDLKQRLSKSAQVEHTIRLRELNKLRGVNLKQAYVEAREEALIEFETLRSGEKNSEFQSRQYLR